MKKKFKKGQGAAASTPFFIRAQADGEPHELLLYDVIGSSYWEDGITAKQVVAELAAVADGDVKARINTRGGCHQEGTAIYNALANHAGHVTISIEGYACSMGSVVACAGDEVEAAENAMIMLHKSSTDVWGNATDLREAADMLDKADSSIITAYTRKTGKTEAEFRALLEEKRNTWLNPAEALELGLIDSISVPRKFAALLNKTASALLGDGVGAALLDGRIKPPVAHLDGVAGASAFWVDSDGVRAMAADLPEEPEEPEVPEEPETPEAPEEPPAPEVPEEPETPAAPPADPAAIAAAERSRCSAIYAQAAALGLAHMAQELIDNGYTTQVAGAMLTQVKAGIDSGLQINNQSPTDLLPGAPRASGWDDAYKTVKR